MVDQTNLNDRIEKCRVNQKPRFPCQACGHAKFGNDFAGAVPDLLDTVIQRAVRQAELLRERVEIALRDAGWKYSEIGSCSGFLGDDLTAFGKCHLAAELPIRAFSVLSGCAVETKAESVHPCAR